MTRPDFFPAQKSHGRIDQAENVSMWLRVACPLSSWSVDFIRNSLF